MHRSVATIDAPEFIDLRPDSINPGISRCEIKVLYLGKNRNGSFIDKRTAIDMAQTLRGTPIVGAWRKDVEDFGDHGHVIHIEDGEVKFSCKTTPYGFVAPDSRVWFKSFADEDAFGNEVIHEYLMAEGYLWTGQYPEVAECIRSGKGQSMELDDETMKGRWETDPDGIDFFIINDATFTKLCILGDDVEPCFEGASITAPTVSREFSHMEDFSRTLFSMMEDLKTITHERGSRVSKFDCDGPETEHAEVSDDQKKVAEAEAAADNKPENEMSADEDKQEDFEKKPSECVDEKDGDEKPAEKGDEDFKDRKSECAADDEQDEDFEKKRSECAVDEKDSAEPEDADKAPEDEDKKPVSENSLEFEGIGRELEALRAEVAELREFKARQESARKDALIGKYHMLSDEDKADIIAHKDEYSYEEIEGKLALAYVKRNADFSTVDGRGEEDRDGVAVTFSLSSTSAGGVASPMVEALREAKKN